MFFCVSLFSLSVQKSVEGDSFKTHIRHKMVLDLGRRQLFLIRLHVEVCQFEDAKWAFLTFYEA